MAIDLAKRGAKVVILCRNKERGSAALKGIKAKSGSDNVEFEQMDLASLSSIRKCATVLLGKLDKIDILLNNAGMFLTLMATCNQLQSLFSGVMVPPRDAKTEDGFELQFGTNHLGHFLLTELLLPLVKKSADSGFHPRIINVSSIGHTFAPKGINFDDLNHDESYESWNVYGHSKLANILHAKELARRLAGTNIRVYSLHPGTMTIKSNLDLSHIGIAFRCDCH